MTRKGIPGWWPEMPLVPQPCLSKRDPAVLSLLVQAMVTSHPVSASSQLDSPMGAVIMIVVVALILVGAMTSAALRHTMFVVKGENVGRLAGRIMMAAILIAFFMAVAVQILLR